MRISTSLPEGEWREVADMSPTWKAQMSSCWRFGLGTNPDARQRRANATLNEIYRGAVGYLKGSHAAELPTFQELDCLS
jgi:hypothetical protein